MRRSAIVLIAAVLTLGACSGGGASPSAAPAAQPSEAPASAAPAGDAGAVRIQNFAFDPASVSVAAGTEVTWTNQDDAPHTVTFQGTRTDDSGQLAKGATFSLTFDAAGSFEYVCTIHPAMKGTVDVTD